LAPAYATIDWHQSLAPLDRYADRLDEAATDADAAKMRPDESPDNHDNDGVTPSTWALGGALGGTRTPNLLIRSQMLYPLSYERKANPG
jgi:hypothetical protein